MTVEVTKSKELYKLKSLKMVGQPEAEAALTNYESKKVGWSSKVAAAVPSN